eukprot:TRINITY_DN11835_c0_g1_i2.p1 TRINITY_DN11835_c0_g1~~TRINITY_DN11835_c0_g1_i2.p1  ORF type:complete len:364 (-),score=30.16 TRINITY_DN11835_c0_g1_i2:761-1852(-)
MQYAVFNFRTYYCSKVVQTLIILHYPYYFKFYCTQQSQRPHNTKMTVSLSYSPKFQHRKSKQQRMYCSCFNLQKQYQFHSVAKSQNSTIIDSARNVAGIALASFLLLSGPSQSVENYTSFQKNSPLADVGKILGSEQRKAISQQLIDLEQQTGWKIRIATKQSQEQFSSFDLRSAWLDSGSVTEKRMAIIQIDTSAPNIIKFDYLGDDYIAPGGPLRRPFWIELQSRFGNIFFVRQEGETAVVENIVDSIQTCLNRPAGCQVVPGLPENQYYFTLILSIAGGIVCGFVSRLEPQGFVKQRWVWVLLFSPLWASLFVSFGLGPIVTRTDDVTPLVANTAAFLATVAIFWTVRGGPIFPKEESQT